MVVELIIAISLAIAIPTFLGARSRAQDKAAQSSLRNALTASKVIYTDKEDYALATPGALLATEPSLTFQVGTVSSTGPKDISVNSTSANVITLSALSKSGSCFWMKDDVSGAGLGTSFNSWAAPVGKAGTEPAGGWSTSGF